MALAVETFEAVETMSDGVAECDKEALALVESLGLDGQKKLNSPYGDVDVRCPYRKMTTSERFVYEELLGKRCKIEDYGDGPIPLRVLQVASHAHEMFDWLEVWHQPNADVKDPLLVGCRGKNTYDCQRFVLARWGEVLEPMEKLFKRACESRRQKVVAAIKKISVEVEARRACIESSELNEFADLDKMGKIPSFYE